MAAIPREPPPGQEDAHRKGWTRNGLAISVPNPTCRTVCFASADTRRAELVLWPSRRFLAPSKSGRLLRPSDAPRPDSCGTLPVIFEIQPVVLRRSPPSHSLAAAIPAMSASSTTATVTSLSQGGVRLLLVRLMVRTEQFVWLRCECRSANSALQLRARTTFL